jgi:hypothetical protein
MEPPNKKARRNAPGLPMYDLTGDSRELTAESLLDDVRFGGSAIESL